MISVAPVTLEGHGVRLEPLTPEHEADLRAATMDGRLWELWYTVVPEPDQVARYIADALAGQEAGHMLPWAVRELSTDMVIGSTRYHDISTSVGRVEIGYTWYAARWQRSHINTASKLLRMTYSFDTVGCGAVGLRTDRFNVRSQRAIEALGAMRDGILRHHQARRDGTIRDSVVYSILRTEWPDVQRNLTFRLEHGGRASA